MTEVKYPIGDSSFRYIRENGFLYIDKTEAIYKLTHYTKYYFLSRPRRFGKSLLVSTLEAYFRGQRQLFDGLAIAAMEKEWIEYPVLRLDLSADDMSRCEGLNAYLHAKLGTYEDIYGQNSRETSFGTRFKGIIQRAYEKTGRGVVILIDEYDNPMISTFGKPEVYEQMRTTLKVLYSVLKAESEHIRFCFLTGITRFSKMSIFSGLNNLEDITLDLDYAGICGITRQEIENNCTEGIKALMQRKGWSYEQTLNRLRDYYDGYHFSKDSPDIYNPFSLLLALKKRDIQAYWNESGERAEFLWKAISRRTESKPLNEVLSPILRRNQLGASENGHSELPALLFQTGYLTIKEAAEEGSEFQLGVPNREVLEGIMYGLLPFATHSDDDMLSTDLYRLRRLANDGETEAMLRYLQSFLAGIGNRLTKKMPEIYYENNLYIIFTLIGVKVSVEVETSDGRMDVLMKCRHHIYVIELKLDRSPEEALEQIRHRHYALSLERSELPITLIGINFSTTTRNIESWKWEKL